MSFVQTSWSNRGYGEQSYPIAHSTILYGTGKTSNFGQFQTNFDYFIPYPAPSMYPLSPAVAVGDMNADGFDDILFDQYDGYHQGYIQLGSTEITPSTPTTPPQYQS